MASATAARSAIRTAPDRRPAVTYFALTIALSWGVWIPLLTLLPTTPLRQLALVPGAFGPAVAAAVVTRLRGESVREWLRSALDWRRPARWYLVALGLPVLVAAGIGVTLLVDGDPVDPARVRGVVLSYPFALAFATLLGGGQEEFGWRGFAQPHLQARTGALTASLAVGVVWASWHAPLFVYDVAGYGALSPVSYAAAVLAFAVVFGWYYNGSRGCVPGAVLLHGSVNASVNVPPRIAGGIDALPVPFTPALAVGFGLVAALVVVRHGPATLSAGPAVRPGWTATGSRSAGDDGSGAEDDRRGAVDRGGTT